MRKRSILALLVCCAVGIMLVACVPQENGATSQESEEGFITSLGVNVNPNEMLETLNERNEIYAPKVITLENGVRVQPVPDSSYTWRYRDNGSGTDYAYNTYYLNAENRGCDSCHKDGLQAVVNNDVLEHPKLIGSFESMMVPMDCKICHNRERSALDDFGSLIHGIHMRDSFKGECMSCHGAYSDGDGTMPLWEEVRYELMQGITSVSDVSGEFDFDQTTLTDGLFDYSQSSSTEEFAEMVGKSTDNVPLDQDVFNNWEIEITGDVKNPISKTLPELIDEYPSETFIATADCVINWAGGNMISNVEVTGIPLMDILADAGVQDSANGFDAISSVDDETYWATLTLESIAENGAFLVYEVNGQPLSWREGYPVRLWVPGSDAGVFVRWVNEISVRSVEDNGVDPFYLGLEDWNRPNAGIMNLWEGQIIPVGEEHEFSGYADGYGEDIIAIEFSMDGGETWTRYETPDTWNGAWVYWRFRWTPEEESAYVLSVRSVTESGAVSPRPDQIMFNAKDLSSQ